MSKLRIAKAFHTCIPLSMSHISAKLNKNLIFLIISLFAIGIMTSACNRQSKRALRKGKVLLETTKILKLGKGGGFTGGTITFEIHPDAKVWQKRTTPDEVIELKTLSNTDFNQIHARFDSLDFLNVSYKKPGNMYHFLAIDDMKTQHAVTWGDDQSAVPQEVQDFYDYLIEIIRKDDNP